MAKASKLHARNATPVRQAGRTASFEALPFQVIGVQANQDSGCPVASI
jgi:hypothetical protein